MKKVFEIEWDENLGKGWMNIYNLELCLFSDCNIRKDLIKVRELPNDEEEPLCNHCQMPLAIRNPSGYCDHLYYPECCEICSEKLKPTQEYCKCGANDYCEGAKTCFCCYKLLKPTPKLPERLDEIYRLGPHVKHTVVYARDYNALLDYLKAKEPR